MFLSIQSVKCHTNMTDLSYLRLLHPSEETKQLKVELTICAVKKKYNVYFI